MSEVSLHQEAIQEIEAAARFYESKEPGLGIQFILEVRRVTALLLRSPELAPVFEGTIRRKLLDRFPYSLLFYTTSSGIRIVSLMHQSRRPGYWADRR